MQQTDTHTKKDLLNDALTLFEWAVNERIAGRMIASVDEGQQRYKEVVMPSLERALKVNARGSDIAEKEEPHTRASSARR
jgi:hypothetical protein